MFFSDKELFLSNIFEDNSLDRKKLKTQNFKSPL